MRLHRLTYAGRSRHGCGMITMLVFALAGAAADSDATRRGPAAPAFIADLFSDGSAYARGWTGEPEQHRHCRLYNCGLPILPKPEKRLDDGQHAREPDRD